MGLYQRGRVWWGSFTGLSGRQQRRSTRTSNKRTAQRILDGWRGEELNTGLALPRSKCPRLGDWAKEFLQEVAHENTRNRYSASVTNLNEFFGRVRLSDITSEAIYKFQRSRLASGIRRATVNRDTSVLSGMLGKAKKLRYINYNPSADVDMLDERRERRESKPLSFDEESRLIGAAEPLLRMLAIIVIETGLRPKKEALPLRWPDIVLDNSVPFLIVRCSKTPAGIRSVPLTSRCVRELREWKQFLGLSNSDFVFPAPRNPARHWTVYQDAWERAAKLARLEGRRFYDLRSTFATRAHSVYPNNLAVAKLLGHSTPAILPAYAKEIDENTRAIIEGLDTLRTKHEKELIQ